jgi:hypothetical protein
VIDGAPSESLLLLSLPPQAVSMPVAAKVAAISNFFVEHSVFLKVRSKID